MRGSLQVGSHILSGSHYAKVRVMTASTGAAVKVATPGMAVTVCGWKTLPKAGDNVIEGSETDVKKALANRIRQSEIEASLADVDAINESRKAERELREAETKAASANRGRPQPKNRPSPEDTSGPKELRLLIKADVSGSAEAVEGALQGIGNKIATSKITQTGVGDVTETDVMMAKTANGEASHCLSLTRYPIADHSSLSNYRRVLRRCPSINTEFGGTKWGSDPRIQDHLQAHGRRARSCAGLTAAYRRDEGDR